MISKGVRRGFLFLQASIRSEGSDGWAAACLTEPRREMKTFGFCRLATTFPDGLW
ncbi:hypothetical protein B4114_2314 [Geobacillus stearothermophilus]|uniref:Uncharacterized protein n=1 Tax=Geobacillus stearothermophilus TaxID=1422 RepID=A0A150NBZ0_GEOSE|nr:hypothetical protein B4114_2314 [Geobacillus stearothermophilus]